MGGTLVEAVARGVVRQEAVDAKLARVLRLAGRVGALKGVAGEGEGAPTPWPQDDIAPELRTAAAASFVLARNEGDLLPLLEQNDEWLVCRRFLSDESMRLILDASTEPSISLPTNQELEDIAALPA